MAAQEGPVGAATCPQSASPDRAAGGRVLPPREAANSAWVWERREVPVALWQRELRAARAEDPAWGPQLALEDARGLAQPLPPAAPPTRARLAPAGGPGLRVVLRPRRASAQGGRAPAEDQPRIPRPAQALRTH